MYYGLLMDSHVHLPIFFRVTSLALGQSHDCPSASEVTLKDVNILVDWYLTMIKHSKVWTLCQGSMYAKIFYRPNFPNSAFSRSAYKEYRRKLCFNPLAWLVLSLALGCRAVKYVEPCHRYFWTHRYHGDIFSLTHWGRVMHIWVSKLTLLSSHKGLLPRRRQAIICTNAGILLIWNLGTKFNEISSEIYTFSFKKMLSGKWRPFCLSLNVLIEEMICW